MVLLYKRKKTSLADVAFRGWFPVVLVMLAAMAAILLARGLLAGTGAPAGMILAIQTAGIMCLLVVLGMLAYAVRKRNRINQSVVRAIISGRPETAENFGPAANPLAPPPPVRIEPAPAPVVQCHPAVPPPLPMYIPPVPVPTPPPVAPPGLPQAPPSAYPQNPQGMAAPPQPQFHQRLPAQTPTLPDQWTLEQAQGGFYAEFICPACGKAIRNRPVGYFLTCEHCGETGYIQ